MRVLNGLCAFVVLMAIFLIISLSPIDDRLGNLFACVFILTFLHGLWLFIVLKFLPPILRAIGITPLGTLWFFVLWGVSHKWLAAHENEMFAGAAAIVWNILTLDTMFCLVVIVRSLPPSLLTRRRRVLAAVGPEVTAISIAGKQDQEPAPPVVLNNEPECEQSQSISIPTKIKTEVQT